MRYRPLLPRSSNARTTYGRLRLLSSAASQASRMSRTTESEELSCLLEDLRQVELQATEPKFIISLGDVPNSPKTLELQWSEAIQLFHNLESALLMSSKECSGPH
jgi:hypothetical protein